MSASSAVRVTAGNTPARLGEITGMTTEQDPPPIHGLLTPAPPARRRRWWPWAVAAIVVAAALGAGAVVLLNRADAPTASTFTMNGELTVDNVVWDNASGITPTPCTATGGYTDIVPGAAVVVQDPQGQTVATGALQSGREAGDGSYSCQFPFTVPNVPDNLTSYSVTISHRGTQVLDPATAHALVELSLTGS